ncbi:MAG: ribosome biogenesis GTP-binding protein YsxC [candidate division SR1 bacterium]|nr:ribosome biogenesis GTP-binding protein YsxC [candidate division SR1 bacterium]
MPRKPLKTNKPTKGTRSQRLEKPKKLGKPVKKVERKFKPKDMRNVAPALIVAPSLPKAAFIGRSNVGKSSLINFLLNQNVAKTSKHPGKTREHTLFRYSDKLNFLDMPGYGYAKVRKERRNQWDQDLLKLFFEDSLLQHVFVLIDISIEPMKIDQDFADWLVEHQIPYSVVFTKTDKAKQQDKAKNLNEWNEYLETLRHPYELGIFQVSVHKKQGAGELRNFINLIKSA